MGCVARGDIDLVSFLREVAAANMDGATSVMFLGQMLEGKASQQSSSAMIEVVRDESESKLLQMLGAEPEAQ